jgi:hypothetical protein
MQANLARCLENGLKSSILGVVFAGQRPAGVLEIRVTVGGTRGTEG